VLVAHSAPVACSRQPAAPSLAWDHPTIDRFADDRMGFDRPHAQWPVRHCCCTCRRARRSMQSLQRPVVGCMGCSSRPAVVRISRPAQAHAPVGAAQQLRCGLQAQRPQRGGLLVGHAKKKGKGGGGGGAGAGASEKSRPKGAAQLCLQRLSSNPGSWLCSSWPHGADGRHGV